METIKFVHDFPKLHGQKIALLTHVEVVSRTELCDEMVEKDTKYFKYHEVPDKPGETIPETVFYPIPNGSLLLLVFLGDKKISFTTLRQFKDATWRKLKAMLKNKELEPPYFEVVIDETTN